MANLDPPALFSTNGGTLATTRGSVTRQASPTTVLGSANNPAAPSASSVEVNTLYREAHVPIVGFSVDPEDGQDVFCLTGQECLVYLRRVSA
jgi:hypothetical protein